MSIVQKLKDLMAALVMGSWSERTVVCGCGHDGGCHGCPWEPCDSCGALTCLVIGCQCEQMSDRKYQWREYFSGVVFRTRQAWGYRLDRVKEIVFNRHPETCDEEWKRIQELDRSPEFLDAAVEDDDDERLQDEADAERFKESCRFHMGTGE